MNISKTLELGDCLETILCALINILRKYCALHMKQKTATILTAFDNS